MRESPEALQALTEAIGTALRADAAVIRALDDEDGALVARTVWAGSRALGAELIGSRRPADPGEEQDATTLRLPIRRGDELVGELELLRLGEPFGDADASLAQSAAAQASLVLAAGSANSGNGASAGSDGRLALAGDALAAGGDAGRLAYLAVEAAGAASALLWRCGGDEPLTLAAEVSAEHAGRPGLEDEAEAARAGREPVLINGSVASIRLGEPPLGILQLVFEEGTAPHEEVRALLASFGVRAAQALRSSEALEETEAELERTRALVAVIGQAISQLSLSHTLETAVDRIAALLDVKRVAIYLRESGRLNPVAGLGLVGPHARVAERLLLLALGPLRGRQVLIFRPEDARTMLAGVSGEMAESGIEAALAVPLLAQDSVIGLLAVYPGADRAFDQNEISLISALAAQLAVAVENARLHEETQRLAAEREDALRSEQQKARQLRAQYEIAHSFTHSLSLEATLEAVTKAVVEVLEIDAAVMRMPDGRGDALEARSVHVANPNLFALETILSRDQPASALWRSGEPVLLDRKTAAELPGHELLVPFLERGATGVVVPVAISGETLATLTLLSLDPERPLRGEVVESARSIAGQAALAIDNARLYQQQKSFSDAMQRSLLPRSEPQIPGLDVGAVYESSARVDVGGDVFDFLALPDGRLAVVLGDVTGHGIEAAADMAMAKFVFRSLTREHPEPGDFLAAANEVVTSEIGFGKFITMASVLVDAARGEIVWASAGHPPGRLVGPDGAVTELPSRGLALGIDAGQTYDEVRVPFEPGAALVLYTDGLVERRRGADLYGTERLDEAVARAHSLPAKRLAQTVLADCRAFGSGGLTDDCAIVVIKRTDP